MTSYLLVKFVALLLWSHAAVLAVAWFRAVGAEDRRTHVGHFVALMGVFVPVSCLCVLAVLAAAMLQVSLPLVLLVVLLPAGLVLALHLEVTQIAGRSETGEIKRWLATTGVAAGIVLWQGAT